jgi:Holliday junction DNA helicase RuvA
MFAYIKGQIISKGTDSLVIDNNGIGYQIMASAGLLERFPESGKDALIYTYHYVREDIISLYGFPEKEDLDMFRLLLTVSGIGPKVASAMTGSISPGQFALAVVTGDTKALMSVKGIGKKGAERMILELKDKLKHSDFGGSDVPDKPGLIRGTDSRQSEAISALMVLGYGSSEAVQAVAGCDKPDLPLQELIRLALRQLSR